MTRPTMYPKPMFSFVYKSKKKCNKDRKKTIYKGARTARFRWSEETAIPQQ